jgi:iron complex outermembrane receptor protein
MKSITIKSLYIFLLFLVFTGTAFAQAPKLQGKVSGSLQDEQGKAMDYATVSLLRAKDSSVVKGALSNDAGLYIFDRVNPGNYVIRTTAVGFEKATSNAFTISESLPNFSVPLLKMKPASHTLNTVTVTSSKPLIEHKVDRTIMNVENSILAAGNSAMEILERAPGVSVDKDDNISIKGKQGVTVMINDCCAQPMGRPFHLSKSSPIRQLSTMLRVILVSLTSN